MPDPDPRVLPPATPSDLARELAPLAALVREGTPESREQFWHGMVWNPAGVLLEQVIADLTLVYSLPKVGGTTAEVTLARHPAVRPEPLHIHFLSPDGMEYLERLAARFAGNTHAHVCRAQLALSRSARVLLAANRAARATAPGLARKPFVVAGTRDPVALYLSLAFEGWWQLTDRFEKLTPEFLRNWVRTSEWPALCGNWFTNELQAVFGTDVYARPFPHARGWDLYENDAARVLVIRQENLDALAEALGALYGLDPASFVVGAANTAEKKDYAAHYDAMCRAVRFTDAELDSLYAAPFVRHFYTPAEVAAFKARWRVGSRTEPPRGPRKPAPAPRCEHRPEPHIGVCRPCWRCNAALAKVPHLEHRCAAQAAQLDQLQAANAAARARLDALDRRRPMALVGRLLRRLRAAVRPGARAGA